MNIENVIKKRINENSKDIILPFLLDNGNLRGVIVNSTRTVKDMKKRHSLGPLEALILGQACTGSLLMASTLKGQNRLKMHIECSGPVKGLVTEANAYGDVRGYLFNNPIPVDPDNPPSGTSSLFNAGFFNITYLKEDSKTPYSGKIMMEYGEIAKEITNYYLKSEQIPSACNLSVNFSEDGEVSGAGGIMIQKMPGASDDMIEKVEESFINLPSPGEFFQKDGDPEELIKNHFSPFSPKILQPKRVAFSCTCERERMAAYINGLGEKVIKEILEEENFPLEVKCHYCSKMFYFERDELENMLAV